MHCRGATRSCASTLLFHLLLLKADRINPFPGTSWSWWEGLGGKGMPVGSHSCRPRAIIAVSCANVGGFPCSQQTSYCVREIICCVWLPSLAAAQAEYVCLQSQAVSWLGCSWFLLFTFPDTHCRLGPDVPARGGMTARQARALPVAFSHISSFCHLSSLQAAGFQHSVLPFSKGEVSLLSSSGPLRLKYQINTQHKWVTVESWGKDQLLP